MIVANCTHEHTKKVGKNKAGNPRVRCTLCGKTWTVPRPSPLAKMRIDVDLAERILKCLCEGNSVLATARMNSTTKRTVLNLMLLVGRRCQLFLQTNVRGVAVDDVQVDEAWQFVYCKQKTANRQRLGKQVGDSYVFTAIERGTKLLVAWHFGSYHERGNSCSDKLQGPSCIRGLTIS